LVFHVWGCGLRDKRKLVLVVCSVARSPVEMSGDVCCEDYRSDDGCELDVSD
jgi:hypothetical protein